MIKIKRGNNSAGTGNSTDKSFCTSPARPDFRQRLSSASQEQLGLGLNLHKGFLGALRNYGEFQGSWAVGKITVIVPVKVLALPLCPLSFQLKNNH